MANDMIILARTFDLLVWLGPRTERFPKNFRHTITQRLMDTTLDFQETLFHALHQGGTTRQKHLRTADAHLDLLRFYLRLVHQLRWLNDGQYRHVSEMVAEIGRLLGGWMKPRS